MNEHVGTFGVLVEPRAVRFERLLPGPIERVWDYLTDGEKRGRWLASGPMDLRPGASFKLFFNHADLSPKPDPTPERFKSFEKGVTLDGKVLRCEPPRLLVQSWENGEGHESEVTFELAPEGEKVRLVLTHRRLSSRKGMLSVSGGWHTHLGVLEDVLTGRSPKAFWPIYLEVEKEYDARLPADD